MSDRTEPGILSRRQIASLAELAPMNHESGTFDGHRTIIGEDRMIRTALYMPTISVIRFNPLVNQFYTQLRSSGKPPKVAITAFMRKLLIILKAVVLHKIPRAVYIA